MRLLHTSDWHVGRAIAGRSRSEEFEAALDEVVRIAKDERADAVLISGDMFDHKVAHADAERLVFDALARFAAERIPVVAIPGNHDPAERWHAFTPLLDPLGVRVVPFVRPPADGSVIEVPSRDGTERAVVACVPFVPERKFGNARELFKGSENWSQAYAQGMGDLLAEMARSFRADAVNVLMAHLYSQEAIAGGSENELTITPEYAVAPSRFPGTATYLALGHMHRPQAVKGSPAPARYAGSLLQLDFGERGQQKSVVLVEASAGKPAKAREVALSAGRELRDVAGTIDELRAGAAEHGSAWLRVTVKVGERVPGLADEVRAFLPNAVEVKLDVPELTEDESPQESVLALTPLQQYERYYRSKHSSEPPAALLAAFEEVRTAVEPGWLVAEPEAAKR